jgi:TolB-like protein
MKWCKCVLPIMLFMAGQLVAGQPEQITLAVSDLTGQGVKESEAAVISEQLRAELMKSPRIRLIERSQMQEILKEQGFQQSGCTNDACAVEIGQLLGVKNMVVGSIGMAGSYTVLSVRVIDVESGSIVANESIRTKGGIDKVLESGIQDATERLHAGLFPEIAESQPVVSTGEKRSPLRGLLIGGGAAILVGGGITAAVLLSKDNAPDETTNTRIVLP